MEIIQRRHHRRIPKKINISCQHEAVVFDGVTLDICPGGVFVVTDRSLPSKSLILIEIHFDETPSLHCRGEVTWVNRGQVVHYPPGFGVRFLDMEEKPTECLFHLCTDHEDDWSPIPW